MAIEFAGQTYGFESQKELDAYKKTTRAALKRALADAEKILHTQKNFTTPFDPSNSHQEKTK